MPHLQIDAAGVLAIAASVYAFMQAAKKAGLDQFLAGRVAQAFSGFLALGTTFVLAGNFAPNTICMAIAAALAAAGIHAHVKTLATGSLSSPSPTPPASIAKAAVVLLALMLPLGLASCGARATVGVPTPEANIELAAGLADSVAHGLQLAQDSLRTLRQAGEVSHVEADALNARIVVVAQKNDAAIAAIQAAAATSGTGWQSAIQAVAAAASTLRPGTFGIANSSAATTFTVAMSTFEAAASAISTDF